jgi:hypothetical protein
MQLNRAQAVSWVHHKAEQGRDAPLFGPRPIKPQPINGETVERGAQALFEHVFSRVERLDGKHLWVNCDDVTKEAFRSETRSVLEATVPFIVNDAWSDDS